jgi:hypothetical protein
MSQCKKDNSDLPEEEFKITGPGIYETRNGKEAYIHFNTPDYAYFPWVGRAEGDVRTWKDSGHISDGSDNPLDIIKRISDLPAIVKIKDKFKRIKRIIPGCITIDEKDICNGNEIARIFRNILNICDEVLNGQTD